MPPLPGRTCISPAFGLLFSARTTACSRPPEPMTSSFMKKLLPNFAVSAYAQVTGRGAATGPPRPGILVVEQPDAGERHHMPYLSAVSMTLSSRMLPPGSATYLTPLWAARSMLSPKGKKASLPRDTPPTPARKSRFSFLRQLLADEAVDLVVALGALERGVEGEPEHFRVRRRCQRSALSPARRVQWMRLCCPAPTPMVWPSCV